MLESRETLGFFRRENLFLFLSIAVIAMLGWLYIFYFNYSMSSQAMQFEDLLMAQAERWTFRDALTTFVMWSVMMTAMMLPSAMPMILVFSAVYSKRRSLGKEFVPTYIFVLGYLLMWISFSLIMTILQWSLHNISLIDAKIMIINPIFSSLILMSAGIYQFTKVKEVCLKNCQTPFSFIVDNWRQGKFGSFIMGMHHGLFCVGCCWILMILLFVAGVMNLLWILLIAIFVFFEKVIQKNLVLSYSAGTLLIVWGLSLGIGII